MHQKRRWVVSAPNFGSQGPGSKSTGGNIQLTDEPFIITLLSGYDLNNVESGVKHQIMEMQHLKT